jgi:hypothetical protein
VPRVGGAARLRTVEVEDCELEVVKLLVVKGLDVVLDAVAVRRRLRKFQAGIVINSERAGHPNKKTFVSDPTVDDVAERLR